MVHHARTPGYGKGGFPESLDDVGHSDRVVLVFPRPVETRGGGSMERLEGEVIVVAGMRFLSVDGKGAASAGNYGLPDIVDLGEYPNAVIADWVSADEIREQLRSTRRGEVVFPSRPQDGDELEECLDELARRIAREADTTLGGRREQLEYQFDDLADLVDLARAKRGYIKTRAVLGQDFHPWLTLDPRVFRNGCVRPLPSDFQPLRALRSNRGRRQEEAIRIFGEAERETRQIAGFLRAEGYDPRRPHPNAQELLVRFHIYRKTVTRKRPDGLNARRVDARVSVSENGYWELSLPHPDNRTKSGLQRRLRGSTEFGDLRTSVETWMMSR